MPTNAITFDTSLTPAEAELVAGLTTPLQIQAFLDTLTYSSEDRYRSPLTVLRDRVAHCYDGAIFAAAMLRRLGCGARVLDMLPNDRDDDHLLALFQVDRHWGALAKSNFSGLRYREPIYRTVRELVLSYFEDYFNALGEKTLRGYTVPLNLARFDRQHWETDDAALDAIADALDVVRKVEVLTPAMVARLALVDRRALEAGLLGANAAGLFKFDDTPG
jgi:hypothetical protein